MRELSTLSSIWGDENPPDYVEISTISEDKSHLWMAHSLSHRAVGKDVPAHDADKVLAEIQSTPSCPIKIRDLRNQPSQTLV